MQVKAEPAASVEQVIKRDLESYKVFLYMKVGCLVLFFLYIFSYMLRAILQAGRPRGAAVRLQQHGMPYP